MNKSWLTAASWEELLAAYVDASSAHGKATESGNHKVANKNYDVIAAVYGELRQRGLEERKRLLVLLDHKDPGVRCWAASHTLEFAPEESEAVLKALARIQGSLVGFSAEVTLDEWRNGNLKFS